MGLMRLVRCARLAIRLPNLDFSFFNRIRFFISMAVPHWPALLTTLPFLGPAVHLTPRLMVPADLRQTILDSTTMFSHTSVIFIPLLLQ
jgi:hypothetical protein